MDTYKPRLDILPAAQKKIWPELRPIQEQGFVLYGGTAIALRLGHRQSVDFDFFTERALNRDALRAAVPSLRTATVQQDSPNTFELATASGVKIAFYGGLEFGRTGEPSRTDDGVLLTASLDDLMASKLKVILQRSESKDYKDLAAMIRAGVRVDRGLAAAQEIFKSTFPPAESLRAMVYFEGGDLVRLSTDDRTVLIQAAAAVRNLPNVAVEAGLGAPAIRSIAEAERKSPRLSVRPGGPRLGL